MKKIISLIILFCTLMALVSFNLLHNNGMLGATGSPGEATCSNCHGGGPAGTTISITAVPELTVNSFVPGTTYTITITVAHPTQPAFGFDCEILDANNANSGIMTNAGVGVKFGTSGGRNNATHTAPKAGVGKASWTFEWMAPATGIAKIYVAGNAVNSNGNESGDAVANTSLTLNMSSTGIEENMKEVSQISLFPNPANEFTTLTYHLLSPKMVSVDLIDINGKVVKNLANEKRSPGFNSHLIDLKGVEKGIYFIKTSCDGKKISQKLISVL